MESFRNNFLIKYPRYCDKTTDYQLFHLKCGKSKRVLIADKNIKVAKGLKCYFISKGYDTVLVDRWKYLLLEMKREDIFIIFLDIKLIDVQGYKLIPIIEKIRPDITIIITSGTNSVELESLIRDYRVFFYCLKPYDMHEMDLLLKSALGKYK